jgi:hypothetical protein
MKLHPMGEPGETMIGAGATTASLRHITEEQLLRLGTRKVVYLKTGICDGKPAFVLYSADGTALVVVDSVETAAEMVARHGLGFVALH